jgi:hypothetical protein
VTRSRARGRRPGAILATALFTIALMPGLATAANNSRTLWIGAPALLVDGDNDGKPDNPGILTPTPVSRPLGSNIHSTYFEVEILSTDNQNLAHTVLTVTVPIQAGATIHDPYDPGPSTTDADPCVRTDSATSSVFRCDYGSLAAFGERTIAFVVDIASTFDVAHQAATFVSAKVETNNETGPNQQLFGADSTSFQVQEFNANHLDSWVSNGTAKGFSTAALGALGAGKLSSTVSFTTSANETISLTDGTTVPNGKYQCPTVPVVLSCQADFSEAVTATGSFTSSPYFTWTVTALVPKTYSLSQGFVAHYLTGTTDPDWILMFKAKSSFCGALDITSNGRCIRTLTLDKYDRTNNKLTLVLVVDHQGGLKY